MRQILVLKLCKQGFVYVFADAIIAFRVFGEHSRIYLISGETFDVEETVEKVGEKLSVRS